MNARSAALRTFALACLVGFLVSPTAFAQVADSDSAAAAPALDDLLSGSVKSVMPDGISPIRFDAIRDTALSFGAQAGLAHRAAEINLVLDKIAKKNDVVYNFEALMLEGGVIPPVLIETRNNYDQVSDDFIKTGDLYFEIVQQPRFSFSSPNWRSYLYMTQYQFDKSKLTHIDFRDDKEIDLWKQYVSQGYRQGELQADAMLEQNRRRLKRDIEGMSLYYRLLAEGKVTRPFIATSNLGVTGDGKKSMMVGEVLLRITVKPEFVTNPDKWSDVPSGDLGERLRNAPTNRRNPIEHVRDDSVDGAQSASSTGFFGQSNFGQSAGGNAATPAIDKR